MIACWWNIPTPYLARSVTFYGLTGLLCRSASRLMTFNIVDAVGSSLSYKIERYATQCITNEASLTIILFNFKFLLLPLIPHVQTRDVSTQYMFQASSSTNSTRRLSFLYTGCGVGFQLWLPDTLHAHEITLLFSTSKPTASGRTYAKILIAPLTECIVH